MGVYTTIFFAKSTTLPKSSLCLQKKVMKIRETSASRNLDPGRITLMSLFSWVIGSGILNTLMTKFAAERHIRKFSWFQYLSVCQ